jgi:ABC-type Fe3+ transport system permease subunit
METLADYGVSAYFGLTTFTTGIYKAWVVDDRLPPPSTLRCCCCVGLLWLERREQSHALCGHTRCARQRGAEARLPHPCARRRWRPAVRGLVVLLGFVPPAILLQLWAGQRAATRPCRRLRPGPLCWLGVEQFPLRRDGGAGGHRAGAGLWPRSAPRCRACRGSCCA